MLLGLFDIIKRRCEGVLIHLLTVPVKGHVDHDCCLLRRRCRFPFSFSAAVLCSRLRPATGSSVSLCFAFLNDKTLIPPATYYLSFSQINKWTGPNFFTHMHFLPALPGFQPAVRTFFLSSLIRLIRVIVYIHLYYVN